MSDVVAFLRARLDEDEAGARPLIGMPGALTAFGAVAQFIASTSPARVLREVEAKRAILTRYEYCLKYGGVPGNENLDPDTFEDYVLLPLAAVYRDHPDYDPAWA